jgi:hypothetical protein
LLSQKVLHTRNRYNGNFAIVMGQRKEGLPYLRDIHFCEFERSLSMLS